MISPLLKPRDCRHEPYFPGYETVMFVAGNNDLVCHLPMSRCKIEGPHNIVDCKEFEHNPMKLITEDGCLVNSGTLLYYVNYLGKIVPITFGIRAKKTVKYFKDKAKAEEYVASGRYKVLQS